MFKKYKSFIYVWITITILLTLTQQQAPGGNITPDSCGIGIDGKNLLPTATHTEVSCDNSTGQIAQYSFCGLCAKKISTNLFEQCISCKLPQNDKPYIDSSGCFPYSSTGSGTNSRYYYITSCSVMVKCEQYCTSCVSQTQQSGSWQNRPCASCETNYYAINEFCVTTCIGYQYFNTTILSGYSYYWVNQINNGDFGTQNAPSYCATCSAKCLICGYTQPSVDCFECYYNVKRYNQFSSHFAKLSSAVPASGYVCATQPTRSATVFTRTYYVSPDGGSTCTSPCVDGGTEGTSNTYFNSLKKVFLDIQAQDIHHYLEVSITIYLIKSASGSSNFFIDQSSGPTDGDFWKLRVGERLSAAITIGPKISTDCGTVGASRCFAIATERPTIIWRDNYLFLFVGKSLTLSNIIFKGGDLNIAQVQQTANTEICSAPTYTASVDQCLPQQNPFDQSGYLPSATNINKVSTHPQSVPAPEGLIHLEWLADYSAASIPSLTITNCDFKYFVGHKYAKSLISFERAADITITNSVFDSIWFQYGLITNSLNAKIDREGQTVQGSSFKQSSAFRQSQLNKYTCKSFGQTYSTECQKIQISGSTFKKYNPFLLKKTQNQDVFEEGMILALQNIDGIISLKNNTFQDLITHTNHERNYTYDCAWTRYIPSASVKTGQGKTYTTTENNAKLDDSLGIAGISNYKLFVDKHLRSYLNYKREIGTVLHIRNVTGGLIMFNNSFDRNIGTGGVNLLVEGFKNTLQKPIVIEANNFTNNFAYHFAPSFVIRKNEMDLASLDCNGVFIFGNNFKNNIGCNQVFGNVITNCEPNDELVDSVKADYSSGGGGGQSTSSPYSSSYSDHYLKYSMSLESDFSYTKSSNSNDNSYSKFTNYYYNNQTDLNSVINTVSYSNYYTSQNSPAIKTNRITIQNNTCENNLAIISNCFYVQGFKNVFIVNNFIQHNSVPISEIIQSSSFVGTNAFYVNFVTKFAKFTMPAASEVITGNLQHTYAKESSPVMVRLGDYVNIINNTFQNNSAVFTGDFQIAAAITLDRLLGFNPVNIDQNIFKNHIGMPSNIATGSYKMWQYDYCSFPMITYNFWVTLSLSDQSLSVSSTLTQGQSASTTPLKNSSKQSIFNVSNSVFDNNIWNMSYQYNSGTAQAPVYETKKDQLRYFDGTNWNTNFQNYFNKYDTLRKNTQDASTYYSNFLIKFYYESDYNSLDSSLSTSSPLSNNWITDIKTVLQNTVVSNCRNYVGTCFIKNNEFDYLIQNLTFINNELEEKVKLFANTYTDAAMNLKTKPYGAYLCILTTTNQYSSSNSQGPPGAASSSSSLAQDIDYNNVTFKNNTGTPIYVSGYGTLSTGVGGQTTITQLARMDSISIKNQTVAYMPFIQILNSYQVTLKNLTISNSSAISAFLLQEGNHIAIAGLDLQNNTFTKIGGIKFSQVTLGNASLNGGFLFNNSMPTSYDYSSQLDQNGISEKTITPTSLITCDVTSVIIIRDTVILNNVYVVPGLLIFGQMYVYNLTIMNTTAVSNISSAIYLLAKSYLFIYDSRFLNMFCKNCSSGVIWINEATMNATNITAVNCSASNSAVVLANTSTVKIYHSNFTNNFVNFTASAVQSLLGSMLLYNSSFRSNNATTATVYTVSTTMTINFCSFSNNYATSVSKNLFVQDSNPFYLADCNFLDYRNDSWSAMAAFLFSQDSDTKISNSIFIGGYAYGGGVFIQAVESISSIYNSTFRDAISSTQQGGGVYALTQIGVDLSSFSNITNQAGNQLFGSCLHVAQSLQGNVTNSIFQGSNSFHLALENLNSTFLTNVTVNGQNITFLYSSKNDSKYSAGILINSCAFQFLTFITTSGTQNSQYGGGIYIFQASIYSFGVSSIIIKMTQLNLTQNQAINGAGLCIANQDQTVYFQITLNNSMITNNVAQRLGGGIYYGCYHSSCSFSLINVTTTNNNAIKGGGGMYFTYQRMTLDDTSPLANNTAFYGPQVGCYPVYLGEKVNPTLNDYYFGLGKSTLRRFLEEMKEKNVNIREEDEDQIFQEEHKQQKNIRRILALPNQYLPSANLTGITQPLISGQNAFPPPVLTLMDEFGQQVTIWNNSQIQFVSGDSSLLINSGSTFTCINGSFIIYPFLVTFKPGASSKLKITTNAIIIAPGRTYGNFKIEDFPMQGIDVKTFVRSCIDNEKWTDNNQCQECKSGTMNVFPTQGKQCEDCPEGSLCNGGQNVGPQPTYWRFNESSRNFLLCDNPKACLGAFENSTDINRSAIYCPKFNEYNPFFCPTGWCNFYYKGNMCNTCIQGYAKSGKDCVSCSSNPVYYVVLVIIILVAVAFVVITIRDTLQEKDTGDEKKEDDKKTLLENNIVIKKEEKGDSAKVQNSNEDKEEQIILKDSKEDNKEINQEKDKKEDEKDKKEGEEEEEKKEKEVDERTVYKRESVLMKILMNYFQLIAIVGSFQFKWPSTVDSAISTQSAVQSSTETVFSFDCFLDVSPGSITIFFSKLLIISISPFFLCVLVVLVWILIFIKRYGVAQLKERMEVLKANSITSMIVIIFLIHQNIVQITIRSLRCRNLTDIESHRQVTYMYEDYDVQCWVSTHLKYVIGVSIPSLIIWGLTAPLLALYVLRNNQTKLDQDEFKRPYGFLYLGYKGNKYYWEFVILYRKILMVFISVFMSSLSLNVQAISILGVGFVSYILQMKNMPFLDEDLNVLERNGLISATLTLYFGIYFLSTDISFGIQIVFFLLIIASNFSFLLYWVKTYGQFCFCQFFINNKIRFEMLKKFENHAIFKKIFGKKNDDSKVTPLNNNQNIILIKDKNGEGSNDQILLNKQNPSNELQNDNISQDKLSDRNTNTNNALNEVKQAKDQINK